MKMRPLIAFPLFRIRALDIYIAYMVPISRNFRRYLIRAINAQAVNFGGVSFKLNL